MNMARFGQCLGCVDYVNYVNYLDYVDYNLCSVLYL